MNWQRMEDYNYSNQNQPPQSQPPPYPAYPQYPYYPPQYAPPYPPGPKKDSKVIIIVVVVVLILVVVLPIIIAGVLYVWVSGFESDGNDGGYVKMTATRVEYTNAYKITIASVSGGDLNIEDAGFELVNDEGTRIYSVHIGNANPTYVSKDLYRIYPIPSGSTAVQDSTTFSTVTGSSELNDYTDCYMAIVDQNDDGKINANDSIWIYKDWTRDGTLDIQTGYRLSILDGDRELVYAKEL